MNTLNKEITVGVDLMEELNNEVAVEEEMLKVKKGSKGLLVLFGVLITTLLIFLILLMMTSGYGKIYDGISVNGIKVGGMTTAEAEKVLNENYKDLSDLEISVRCKGDKSNFRAENINSYFDSEAAAKSAYAYGRSGNVFKRVASVISLKFAKKDLTVDVSVDRKKIDTYINKLTEDIVVPVVQPSYERNEDVLLVKNGIKGIEADTETARKTVIENLTKMQDSVVQVETREIIPEKVDIQKIQNSITQKAQNADYETDKGNLIEQKIGIEIKDIEQAKVLVDSITKEGMQISIPLLITLPEKTTKDVLNEIFKDELSTYTTQYNVNEKERTENVKLAASFVNDVMLMPGQEFSYNNIVGERSTERGFKTAKVYQKGQVVDGLGGGICQVSSTLYNAAVIADLEILERKNHSLPVSYVKLGRDATVSYGTIDFRFRNSRQYPIKIEASAVQGVLTVKIFGYNTNKGRTVDIETEQIGVLGYTETEIEDAKMPVGTSKITTVGKRGYKIKSYRVTKEDGKVIEKKLISTDTYSPIAQIKHIGTMQ